MLLLAQITPLADLSRVSLDLFFNSFRYHVTQFHCCNVSITIQAKKLKLNKMLTMLVMSCIFMSCNFMSCNFDGPSFSCPSFSAPPGRVTVTAKSSPNGAITLSRIYFYVGHATIIFNRMLTTIVCWLVDVFVLGLG